MATEIIQLPSGQNGNQNEELSAYLQGEVGRNMWPAAAMVLCPKCH